MKRLPFFLLGHLFSGCILTDTDREERHEGIENERALAADRDGDGTPGATDCDDNNAEVHPGTDEICDGTDNDCDGYTDEDDAVDALVWHADADSDGYGDLNSSARACNQPARHLRDGTDCDDGEATSYPGADELCDGLDNDCDGNTDEDDALDMSTWFYDGDGDGYGNAQTSQLACAAPSGFVADPTDCDDNDATTYPGSPEYCDDHDDDCDGVIDEDDAVDADTWYPDADGDGYGTGSDARTQCEQPTGFSDKSGDCDDVLSYVNPGADETWYDGVDQDCDGESDYDQDHDSYDSASEYKTGLDCDDNNVSIHPGAKDTWYDGDDQDCDGASDYDQDADGYDHNGYGGTDCDDYDADVYPGAWDWNDGVDGDCDGVTGTMALEDATAIVEGNVVDGYLGWSVAFPGDVNGDGNGEIIMGYPGPGYDGTSRSAAWVFFGPLSGTYGESSVDVRLVGEHLDWGGAAVAGAGDVDADGLADILVGAYQSSYSDREAGVAFLVTGRQIASLGTGNELNMYSNAYIMYGEPGTRSLVGCSVASAGDVNDDGRADILIGAERYAVDGPGNVGAAYLVLGTSVSTMVLSAADAVLEGESTDDLAGHAVAPAGDLDADGYDDLLVGAPSDDDGGTSAGAIYAIYGPVSGTSSLLDAGVKVRGTGAYSSAGGVISSAGDVNSDGYADILAGVTSRDQGAALVLLGPLTAGTDLSMATARLEGQANDYAGSAVSAAGDMDHDGYEDDFVVGASGLDGRIYVLLGPVSGTTSLTDADAIFEGQGWGMGNAVAGGGDSDGDGWPELLAGAHSRDVEPNNNAGTVYLFPDVR